MNKKILAILAACLFAPASLGVLVGASESAGTPDGLIDMLEQQADIADAVMSMPLEDAFLPPMTEADGLWRAKKVIDTLATPLLLANTIELLTTDTTETPVEKIAYTALNVMAYYATVGYDEDPEFGDLAQARLQQAVEVLVGSGWDTESLFPTTSDDPEVPEAETPAEVDATVAEIEGFVSGLFDVDMDGVETFAPTGQELGRDLQIVESETMQALHRAVQEYRSYQRVDHSIIDTYYRQSYSYHRYLGGHGYSFDNWDYWGYRLTHYYRIEQYTYIIDQYEQRYNVRVSADQFQHFVDNELYYHTMDSTEFVRGMVSLPYASSGAGSVDNPEGILLSAIALPFAFESNWWSYVLKWDHDESLLSRSNGYDYGSYYYSRFYQNYYYRQDYQYEYGYTYHRHWYVVCGWWSCYWTYYNHYHGGYSHYRTTYQYSYNYVDSYSTSYSWHNQYDNRYANSANHHINIAGAGGRVMATPGVLAATEGTITMTVPAKQYAPMPRDNDLFDDSAAFGYLLTQVAPTRYDEECANQIVVEPTANACQFLLDEDPSAGDADGSDAEVTIGTIATDSESAVDDAVAAILAATASPEETAAEALASVVVPEAPEAPAAPDAESTAAQIAAAAALAAADAEGAAADASTMVMDILADPESFAAAAEGDARDATVTVDAQAIPKTIEDDLNLRFVFNVEEFIAGVPSVVTIGLISKEGLTALDAEDIVIKVTGRGVGGESPSMEYSEGTPCADSQIDGRGNGLFPAIGDTTPDECVRDSDEGTSAPFRLMHALDLDGADVLPDSTDSQSVNVGDSIDAVTGTEAPEAPEAPELPDAPELPEAPGTPPMP